MDELSGRTAVVTGGGSGIGRALVHVLAGEGMNVVVADIEEDRAREVAVEIRASGVRAIAVEVDVSDFASVSALADAAYAKFAAVNVLCNNAGVLIMSPITELDAQDWSWLFAVNVLGVAHGVHAFLPRMLDQGEPAHIVNTASTAALGGAAGMGPYGASKSAVLSMSETLHAELEPRGIGVTALCPGNISSRILGSQRNRPDGRRAPEPFGTDLVNFVIEPVHAARRAVEAIKRNDLYAFVFPEDWTTDFRDRAEARFEALRAAIDDGGVE